MEDCISVELVLVDDINLPIDMQPELSHPELSPEHSTTDGCIFVEIGMLVYLIFYLSTVRNCKHCNLQLCHLNTFA